MVLQAFTKLRANVKADIDIDLQPCTAIVGPNRSSKTGVLDTIRLALTGKHPIGAHPANLAELMPVGYEYMQAVMSGPSGIAHFRQEVPGGKPARPEHKYLGPLADLTDAERKNILPVESVGELVRYGATRAREAVMQRFGEITTITTPIGLNTKQVDLWNEGLKATSTADDVANQLAALSKWFRTEKLGRSKRAGVLARNIEERKATLAGEVVGAELLPDYRRKLVLAEAWERTATLRARRDQLTNELNALRVEAAELLAREAAATGATTKPESELVQVEQDIASNQQRVTQANNAVEVATRILELLTTAMTTDVCPLCRTSGIDVAATHARVDARLVATCAEREQHQTEARRLNDVHQRLRDAIAAFDTAGFESEKARIGHAANQLHAELAGLATGLVGAPASYVGPTVSELEAEIRRIENAQQIREQLNVATREMHLLQDQSDVCKVLETQAGRLLRTYLKSVTKTAEDAVNKYMPLGFQARLVITDTTVEWRVLGTDARAHRRGGMSGSEFGSLIVAVACAWTDNSPLRVLLLDDVDLGPFDPANLHALLNCLQSAVQRGDLTQVIVGWNRPSEIPASWHIVTRGA